jgi:phosphate starvation-inducible PhoH-like protein
MMNDTSKNNKTRLIFSDLNLASQLFGEHNSNLKKIEELVDVSIHVRGNIVFIQGDSIAESLAKNILKQLYNLLKQGYPIYPNDIDYAVRILSEDDRINLKDIFLEMVYVTPGTRPVIPKSLAQKKYIDAIRSSDMVFGIGPAGTGKTYLAMAMAVEAFSKSLVDHIVITRPVVEAGEALGFLPGDIAKKVDPYLRPFYDALHDLIGFEKMSELIEQDIIEVAPIAFMRGRTLNDSFVILDEAQNTTSEQMKMFLTRIGFSSKAVITGDITQSDLPNEKPSGLIEAKNILQDIEEINFIFFSKKDVVRHGLVRNIIKAYEEVERKRLELELEIKREIIVNTKNF